MAKSYSEKLRSPKWQKKRLKIFERDGWACSMCHDKESELHVHHKKYSGEPHEADDSDLTTLCKFCHYIIEINKPLGFDIIQIDKRMPQRNDIIEIMYEANLKETNEHIIYLSVLDNNMNITYEVSFPKNSVLIKKYFTI